MVSKNFMETIILRTRFRRLKTKPIILQFDRRTGHAQLLKAIADHLQVKPHRWAAETHERVTNAVSSRPHDIHIDGAHHLSWKALEVLRIYGMRPDPKGHVESFESCWWVKTACARESPSGFLN